MPLDTMISMDLEEASKRVYEAIFDGRRFVEVEGRKYRVGRTSKLGLRVVSIEDYTFLEQNPEKNSTWGRLSKEGHRILWVMEGGDYIGQVRDRVYHDFRR